MLIDTMFARDMYQVYEINDDWWLIDYTLASRQDMKHMNMKGSMQMLCDASHTSEFLS